MARWVLHPHQYTILDRLADGEGPPPTRRELAEATGLSLSGLTYHFEVLRKGGLVVSEPRLSRTTRITDQGRMVLAAANNV